MSRTQQRLTIGAIVVLAFLLRLYLAAGTAYLWDEDREWIPLGHSISFSAEDRHLPWRSLSHPASAAYIVKATSSLLGDHPLGNRLGFIVVGLLTILIMTRLAWDWLGFRGAFFTALLLTFNEYHLAVSMFAMEKGPYLMCSALSLLCFGRYLAREQACYLYAAAASAGMAFLFKETAGLLLPIYGLVLVTSGRASWLKRREVFLGVAVGLLVVLPDLAWNVVHWEQGFGLHSGRVVGVGFERHYLLFYGRDLVRDVYLYLGRRMFDPVYGYPAMNAGWGALLLISASAALLKWNRIGPVGQLAAGLFWFVLAFFSLSSPGQPRLIESTLLMVDTKAWFWVDLTLLAGALLGAWVLIQLASRWPRLVVSGLVIVAGWSTVRVLRDTLDLSTFAVAMAPNQIAEADGREVEVRTAVSVCQVCKPGVTLVGVRVNRFDGKGAVPIAPGEVLGVDLGTDDREFRVFAAAGPEGRRTYLFDYQAPGQGAGDPLVTARLNIGPQRIAAPFWSSR